MIGKRVDTDRTLDQIRKHYLIERELADRLRSAEPAERRRLYASLYDELFRRVPDHPQLTERITHSELRKDVDRKMRLLAPLLAPDSTFLEIGAGNCALSIEVSRHVGKVYAVEVSSVILARAPEAPNLEKILTDGVEIPVPDGVVNVAYSHQVMEHLHPADAQEQLANIHRSLAPGGCYVCLTPNRLAGPHDVSKYFDDVATGFHLREYTVGELSRLLRETGFSSRRVYLGGRGRYTQVPASLVAGYERLVESLPRPVRRLFRYVPLRSFLGVGMIAQKRA